MLEAVSSLHPPGTCWTAHSEDVNFNKENKTAYKHRHNGASSAFLPVRTEGKNSFCDKRQWILITETIWSIHNFFLTARLEDSGLRIQKLWIELVIWGYHGDEDVNVVFWVVKPRGLVPTFWRNVSTPTLGWLNSSETFVTIYKFLNVAYCTDICPDWWKQLRTRSVAKLATLY